MELQNASRPHSVLQNQRTLTSARLVNRLENEVGCLQHPHRDGLGTRVITAICDQLDNAPFENAWVSTSGQISW